MSQDAYSVIRKALGHLSYKERMALSPEERGKYWSDEEAALRYELLKKQGSFAKEIEALISAAYLTDREESHFFSSLTNRHSTVTFAKGYKYTPEELSVLFPPPEKIAQPTRFEEPPLQTPSGDRVPSKGIVALDSFGRVLLTQPTGQFGGYEFALPKGRPEKGESTSETALREMKEESGFDGTAIGYVGDFKGGSTENRYLHGVIQGGDPSAASWETSRVLLAPLPKAMELLGRNQNCVLQEVLATFLRIKFKTELPEVNSATDISRLYSTSPLSSPPIVAPLPERQIAPFYQEEISDFEKLLQHFLTNIDSYRDAFLILDLDDLLVMHWPALPFLWEPQAAELFEEYFEVHKEEINEKLPQTPGKNFQELFSFLRKRCANQQVATGRVMQHRVPALLAQLQKEGVRIGGSTHRSADFSDQTRENLRLLGIDLERTAPRKGDYTCYVGERQVPTLVKNGIMYCRVAGDYQEKGLCNEAMMNLAFQDSGAEAPSAIIIVDDAVRNLTSNKEHFSYAKTRGIATQLFEYTLKSERDKAIPWDAAWLKGVFREQMDQLIQNPETMLDYPAEN